MKFIQILIIVMLFFSTPSFSSEIDSVAIRFVKELKLGRNLIAMSSKIAKNTQTYKIISNKIGEKDAWMFLQIEVAKVATNYQDQWNNNLASSYLEHFSPDQLESMRKEKRKSPYINDIGKKQKEIGASMHSKSQGIPAKIATEALSKLFSSHVK